MPNNPSPTQRRHKEPNWKKPENDIPNSYFSYTMNHFRPKDRAIYSTQRLYGIDTKIERAFV